MTSRGPGITGFDDRGLAELKNELRRLWDAIKKATPMAPVIPEETPAIILSQDSDPTAPTEDDLLLPGKVIGVVVTNYALYVDPTTGVTLASVKVTWDQNNEVEKVDVYEIQWDEG